MADDAARISQAKRFRWSLAAGPTTLSDSPIDGWRSKRGPPAWLAAAVAARSPRAVASFRLAALRTRARSISRGASMRPRVSQARCRIEADGAAIPSRQTAGQSAHALPMHRPGPMRRLAARFLVIQERTTRRPKRSLAGEGGRGVMSRLSAPHRAFRRASVAGYAAPAPPEKAPVCRKAPVRASAFGISARRRQWPYDRLDRPRR
jgi:hypothetical protein